MKYYTAILPENLVIQRVDKAIAHLLPSISRTQIQKSILEGHLKVNQATILSPTFKVKALDNIEITLFETIVDNSIIQPTKIDFHIIFEDEDVIVIDKPAGLTVHPGNGNHQDTLVNALLYHTNSLSDINSNLRPGIVHRLDKDTTGVMIVAKNNEAHYNLAKQIETRAVKREYKALIWGRINPLAGTIHGNIIRDKMNRTKMTLTKFGGKTATTHYATEEIFLNGLASLVACKLETGRTHQIRVHLSHAGHSLIGDQTYGKSNRKIKAMPDYLIPLLNNFKRQALHSYYIAFTHPTKNTLMEFTAPLPEDIKMLIDGLASK